MTYHENVVIVILDEQRGYLVDNGLNIGRQSCTAKRETHVARLVNSRLEVIVGYERDGILPNKYVQAIGIIGLGDIWRYGRGIDIIENGAADGIGGNIAPLGASQWDGERELDTGHDGPERVARGRLQDAVVLGVDIAVAL